MMKKFALLSLVALLLVSLLLPAGMLHGRAQETVPDHLEYTGEGVVWRSPQPRMRTLSSVSQLDVVYLKCDQSHLTPGKLATWTAQAEGGSGEFEFFFVLFFQELEDTSLNYTSVLGGYRIILRPIPLPIPSRSPADILCS